MKKILCKLGFHKKQILGTAHNPFMKDTVIVAFKCKRCGEKLKDGEIWSVEDVRLKVKQ